MSCLYYCCCCCCICCCRRKQQPNQYNSKKLRESDIIEFEPSQDTRYKKPPKKKGPPQSPRIIPPSPSPPLPTVYDTCVEVPKEYDTFEAAIGQTTYSEAELPYANNNIWDNPYTQEEFAIYLNKQLIGKNAGLQKEFDSLAPMEFRFSSDEAKTMDNRKKNRTEARFIPYDLNRVVLVKESNYINASHINGFYRHKTKYIVAQLPIVATLGDFWEMVWEENVRCIVSLRTEAAQTVFWPKDKGSEQVFADVVKVKLMNEHIEKSVEERTFVVTSEEEKRKSYLLHHIEFKTNVVDLQCPQACPVLLSMVHLVIEAVESKTPNSKLCFVTKSCDSLVGILIILMEVLKPISENCPFSIHQTLDYLLSLRCGLVTEFEHYKLLYLTVLEHLQELRPLEIEDLVKLDVGMIDQESDEMSPVKEEFDKINSFCKKAYFSNSTAIARSPANKNQLINTSPYDFNRVQIVQSPTPSDYVNGSYMRMNSGSCPVIAIAHPTKSSIKEFLWLIISSDVDLVLVLGKTEEIDMMNKGEMQWLSYWGPLSGEKMYGEFRVERSQPSRYKGMLRYNVKILHEPAKQAHREKTFLLCLYREWDENDLPTSNEGLLRVAKYLEEFRGSEEGRNPIVLQSIDGSTKVGLLLAVMCGYHKALGREQLNLPLIVKRLRADRMNMVSSREEYQKCYQILIELASKMP